MRAAILAICTTSLLVLSANTALADAADAESSAQKWCTLDSECGAELCIRGTCAAPLCQSNDDCGDNGLCLNHACATRSCSSSASCDGDQRCVDGQCATPTIERVGSDRREMVLVRGAAFSMGSNDPEAVSDERPQRMVEVSTFWLDRYEVSTAAFKACVDAGACSTSTFIPHETDASDAAYACTYGQDATLPMNCVSQDGAAAYCAWAEKRLATEAEWERAAGGGQQAFPWGNGRPTCEKTCRAKREPGCGTGQMCEIASKPADVSPFGAVDMGGNVGEWVSDIYDGDAYSQLPRLNPMSSIEGERHVVRGGDYADILDPFRVESRDRLKSSLRVPTVGFRCARDL